MFNPEIQKYIEMGITAKSTYETKIKGNSIKLEWRPLRITETQFVMNDALEAVPEYIRNFLVSNEKEQTEIAKETKIPKAAIDRFNHLFAVFTIYYAMLDFYPEITRGQVERLDINHFEFMSLIDGASGSKDGASAVDTFPVDSTPQDTENTP